MNGIGKHTIIPAIVSMLVFGFQATRQSTTDNIKHESFAFVQSQMLSQTLDRMDTAILGFSQEREVSSASYSAVLEEISLLRQTVSTMDSVYQEQVSRLEGTVSRLQQQLKLMSNTVESAAVVAPVEPIPRSVKQFVSSISQETGYSFETLVTEVTALQTTVATLAKTVDTLVSTSVLAAKVDFGTYQPKAKVAADSGVANNFDELASQVAAMRKEIADLKSRCNCNTPVANAAANAATPTYASPAVYTNTYGSNGSNAYPTANTAFQGYGSSGTNTYQSSNYQTAFTNRTGATTVGDVVCIDGKCYPANTQSYQPRQQRRGFFNR